MIILVKQNGLFDIEHRNKLYRDMSKLETVKFLKINRFTEEELNCMDETKNCHFFGNLYNTYMFSKDELDTFLVDRNKERKAL